MLCRYGQYGIGVEGCIVLKELFVGHPVLVLLCARLPGEEARKLLVKVNQVLRVLAPLELVLPTL